jgi:16S rRNA (guanine1207-N2)-methyltransferase
MLKPAMFGAHEADVSRARTRDARCLEWRLRHVDPRPMPASHDPALETLMLALDGDGPRWPGSGLFLGARDGWSLHGRRLPGLACTQDDRGAHDRLVAAGLDVATSDALPADRRWPLVLLLPPRQRDAARGLFAEALARLAPGGRVLACMPNKEGARSGEADLARIAGPVASLSKNHCRAFWTAPLDGPVDPALAASWREAVSPRRVESDAVPGGGFVSRPGIFAWDRVDRASALLAAQLPRDLSGRVADLGGGWGFLSMAVLARNPGITALDLYESDARALDCARRNLQPFEADATIALHWHDVSRGLPATGYDAIVSNPPFHALGREDRPELGQAFIATAADALRPGGRLWLVANRHLPYEAALGTAFRDVRTVAQADGFKVIEAVR